MGHQRQQPVLDTFDISHTATVGKGVQLFKLFCGRPLDSARASDLLFPTFDYAGTYVGIHLAGGIEKPLGDKRAFRAEIRSGFFGPGGSLMLLAGLSF